MTITLNILGIHVYAQPVGDLNSVVAEVVWSITADIPNRTNPNGTQATTGLTSKSLLSSPSTQSFIAFENLTEEQVKAWVEESAEYAEGISKLEKEIEEESKPPLVVKQMPWVEVVENPPEAIEHFPEEIPSFPSEQNLTQ